MLYPTELRAESLLDSQRANLHNKSNGARKTGRGETIRTSDHLIPNQVRYQAALRPEDRHYNWVWILIPALNQRNSDKLSITR